jgi:hypothetical protein
MKPGPGWRTRASEIGAGVSAKCKLAGIVRDISDVTPKRGAGPEVYIPLSQWPTGDIVIMVRTGRPNHVRDTISKYLKGIGHGAMMNAIGSPDKEIRESLSLH